VSRLLRPLWLGLAAVAVVLVAVPVALARRSAASPDARVAPLSATDRRVLLASRSMITALPTAIAEVPQVASNLSGGRVTPSDVRRILDHTSALVALDRAIAKPAATTSPLVAGYRAVLSRHRPASPDQLAGALERLQVIEGDVVPAVRVVAAHSGHSLSATAALSAIERDRHAQALAGLVAGWQQLYGAFTLVEQAAAS
jgi:hypothetical protein